MSATVDYRRLDYYRWQHHLRFARRVENATKKLVCQECHGSGGETIPVLDYGEGPWEECGWCEGTGYITPWLRGFWLRLKREASNVGE